MHTPPDMTRATDLIRDQQEAKERDAARARQTAAAELALKAEAAGRFEAQVRAVPNEMFADDPEIKALRADHEVKQRQRPVMACANAELVRQAAAGFEQRIKERTLDVMIAAIEDVMAGDLTLRGAMVLQHQVDEDARRLAVLALALERLNRFGLGQVAREREDLARQALGAALMERKRQYVREHPEGADLVSDVVEI